MKAESCLILLVAAARRGSDIRDREDEENNIFAAFAPKAASAERERESALLSWGRSFIIGSSDWMVATCERLRVGILLKGYGKDCLSLSSPSVLFRYKNDVKIQSWSNLVYFLSGEVLVPSLVIAENTFHSGSME